MNVVNIFIDENRSNKKTRRNEEEEEVGQKKSTYISQDNVYIYVCIERQEK